MSLYTHRYSSTHIARIPALCLRAGEQEAAILTAAPHGFAPRACLNLMAAWLPSHEAGLARGVNAVKEACRQAGAPASSPLVLSACMLAKDEEPARAAVKRAWSSAGNAAGCASGVKLIFEVLEERRGKTPLHHLSMIGIEARLQAARRAIEGYVQDALAGHTCICVDGSALMRQARDEGSQGSSAASTSSSAGAASTSSSSSAAAIGGGPRYMAFARDAAALSRILTAHAPDTPVVVVPPSARAGSSFGSYANAAAWQESASRRGDLARQLVADH